MNPGSRSVAGGESRGAGEAFARALEPRVGSLAGAGITAGEANGSRSGPSGLTRP
jgi:hypothetical protein